ncbi:MAG TPA: ECF-type sigma factor, partial [Thermoanaerobaculia bacterium]|nr:ECF-type sigma factor [Thermoanaerobaculia bacterium]
FCIAARVMRRILIDHARAKARAKRGGEWRRVTLGDHLHRRDYDALELLVLEDTLQQLEARHPRMAKVVELRVFGGMTMKEIAQALGVSKRTADEDWSFARRWLARELSSEEREDR